MELSSEVQLFGELCLDSDKTIGSLGIFEIIIHSSYSDHSRTETVTTGCSALIMNTIREIQSLNKRELENGVYVQRSVP